MRCVVVLLSISVAGCLPLTGRMETPWQGSGSGRIISGGDDPPPGADSGVRIPMVIPMGRGVLVSPGNLAPLFDAPRWVYEVRAQDGTVHLVGSTTKLAHGDCIAWKGYSDGPSMTQWSTGRVEITRIESC